MAETQGNQSSYKKEYLFTDKDFTYLSKLAGDLAGISLSSGKRELIYGRLVKRLRALGLKDFKQYCALLRAGEEEGGDKEELTNFINSITTNVTSFFRENHHFDFMADTLLPELIHEKSEESRPRLRIWSAGCSSGKEPYSIAMVLKECIPDIERWDAKILATDLDSNILDVAKTGVYPKDHVKEISAERRKRWFQMGRGLNEGTIKVSDDVKNMVAYRQLNLTEAWPMKGSFDIIFCRNVTIYFDRDTRVTLLDRFAEYLDDDGCLFVGHSESLFGLTQRFNTVGRTIHRKIR
ncbi:MAG: protein-glutamate O-methyltransferase CheR [Gammaproteobacteria bacterium]|nr:protein-glutamate O-methyltransferase CheR [Gammaproteobacteria bacterium]